MKRIKVNKENEADTWWDAALRGKAPPSGAFALLDDEDEVTVSDEDAAAFIAWASALPGWEGGPAHAPHPFTVEDA